MTEPRRFAFIRLAPGVLPRHMAVYLVVVFFTSIYMGVINATQPTVLEYVLGMAREQQNSATSWSLIINECVMLTCVALFGVMSDRTGRRVVYVAGFLMAALGAGLFTYAPNLPMLLAFRGVYAIGNAALAAMMVAVVADYPADESRGKANGWQGLIAGFGALVMFGGILRIPQIMAKNAGPNPDMLRIMHTWFGIIAAVGVMGAIAALGLRDVMGVKHAAGAEKKPMLTMAKEAILAAKDDPGLALSYGAAFVSRGDLAVAGAYVGLWIQRHGADTKMTPEQVFHAMSTVGMIAPLTALLAAPIVGILCDRFNRVSTVAFVMVLAAVAYNGTHFISDPTGAGMMAVMAIMGVAEIGGFIASQALVSQQAPKDIRGSVSGFYGFCGALGIMTASTGGFLINKLGRPSAPFVVFGVLNIVLFFWALAVRNKVKTPTAEREPSAVEAQAA